jgi:polyisoprenoid-binding protein YceI
MRKTFAILMTMLAVPAFAATTAKPVPAYEIDSAHTRVVYTVSHMGYINMPGHFSDITGTISFNPDDLSTAGVDITIKTSSVSMDMKALDEHIQGKDFFNIAKYPTITFKSTSAEKTGPSTGTVTGDLTLLGVTKPVTLDVTFNKKGWNKYMGTEEVGFSATTKIHRSDFGMKAYIPDVGDDIVIAIEAEAHQPKAEEKR